MRPLEGGFQAWYDRGFPVEGLIIIANAVALAMLERRRSQLNRALGVTGTDANRVIDLMTRDEETYVHFVSSSDDLNEAWRILGEIKKGPENSGASAFGSSTAMLTTWN